MRKISFINDCYYHIYNRGVEKRDIFMSDLEFQRFYESLYLFNDAKYKHLNNDKYHRIFLLSGHEILKHERDPMVSIVAFCFLPNHFHLLIRQLKKGGISKFMQRVSQGYSRYFNITHSRSGTLYEGTFKAVEIKNDVHLEHLPRYIHFNALDNSDFNWRDGKIENWDKANLLLDNYPWSSHHVYKRKEQILPVINQKERDDLFSSVKDYEDFLHEWGGRTCMPFLHLYPDEYPS